MASAEYMRNYRKVKPHITRAVSKHHYQAHRSNYARYRDDARQRIREIVRKAREVVCYDCKETFPWYVMEFDHTRGEKKFSIARATSHGIDQVRTEIAKCDVVCANCHVIRTYHRGQWFRGNPRKYAAA